MGGCKMMELTKENIEKEIRNKSSLVVDFGAEWCGPCQDLAMVFGNIKNNVKAAEFARVDLAKDESLANIYGIKNYPTIVIFKNGKEVKRFEGFVSEEDLTRKIKSCL